MVSDFSANNLLSNEKGRKLPLLDDPKFSLILIYYRDRIATLNGDIEEKKPKLESSILGLITFFILTATLKKKSLRSHFYKERIIFHSSEKVNMYARYVYE